MGKIRYIISTFVAFACLSGVARAGLIDLGVRSVPSVLGNPSSEANFVQSDLGLSTPLTYLNKVEYGGGSATANVSWNFTGTANQLCYILVKTGRQSGFFLYRLYGVTGDSTVTGNAVITINGAKDISHVTFLGNNGPIGVPEGGATCAMLGMAMTGLWFARRFVQGA